MDKNYFKNLSDAQLRQELRDYCFPVVPITETTRNLIIKKLERHVLNASKEENTSPARTRSPLGRRNRSLTHAANVPRPKSRESRQGMSYLNRDYGNFSANTFVNGNSNSPTNLRSNPNDSLPYLNQGYRIYSANDFVDGNSNSSPPSNMRRTMDYITKCSPKIYLPPPIVANDAQYTPPTKRIDTTPRTTPREFERSRDSSGSAGVVSRLLKLRDISLRSTQPSATSNLSMRSNVYSSDSDSDSGSPTRYAALRKRYNPSASTSMWKNLNIKSKFKQSYVPYLLMGGFALFFAILSILYMTKPPDMPSTMLEKSTTFNLCNDVMQTAALAKPYINCIDGDLIDGSLTLNKELIQLLQLNAETHYCKDRTVSAEVSAKDFMQYIYKKRNSEAHKLLKSLHGAVYLIEQNPQWKIQILNKSDNQQLVDVYRQQDVRFVLLKPYLSLKCILYNKMQRFLFIIGAICLIALLLVVVYAIWRLIHQRSLMKQKSVENFCKEISKELIQRCSVKGDTGGEIIIAHLRDKLIPLNKRKSLLWAWNEALRRLEASDSRIQFATILQNGEEFRTMKWVETTMMSSNHHSPSSLAMSQHERNDKPQKKHWQSPAFDNVNKIFDPPTNCLKIRHMFEIGEANHPDLRQSVIESILEKVGPQCQIYDIQLDRQNCCVYIRCATEKDAGKIHNEINGWWYDNRLVSIKFLRLQRFHARFPSSNGSTALTINNSK